MIMDTKLVIVESPAKARTIGKMLGGRYLIKASMGHVRDLPERSFGVDIEHGFAPQYEETPSRVRVLGELKAAAKKVSEIYLAPDPDREGEAIAWHLREILAPCNRNAVFHRVTFHEITRSAIVRAFQEPTKLDLDKVDAQQARRVLDRIVGYMVSPLLWGRIEKGVSAGRVQSVALRLVCERERAIQAFKPEEYWNFNAKFQAASGVFHARLAAIDGAKPVISGQDQASALERDVRTVHNWTIASVNSVPRKKYAAPPFITSTLQQAAGSAFGFSASSTMRIAQQLYEGVDVGRGGPVGLITYMRTDSVTVSREAQQAARSFIAAHYGSEYLPAKAPIYRSRASTQGAHEAIRPTNITLTPEKIKKFLDDRAFKLYTLVWRRFTASQLAPAEQQRTTAETVGTGNGPEAHAYTFRASATVTTFPGFLRVYNLREEGAEEEDENLRDADALKTLKHGESCSLKDLLGEQKFTEPPPRFSEATLIKELESNGVGRPSTYATIVNTIQSRKYVLKQKGRLIPVKLGFRITDYLTAHLPTLFAVGFTAKMEDRLDQVEAGKLQWTAMMQVFYEQFETWLKEARSLGAPENRKAAGLIALLNTVRQWNPPEKNRTRTYDDQKFFHSLQASFTGGRPLSALQWDALLRMALKYQRQLPALDDCARKSGFMAELTAAREECAARHNQLCEWWAKREEAADGAPTPDRIADVFAAMSAIAWKSLRKNSRNTFDEKKFFDSLRKQNEQGRMLSTKQLFVLGRLAVRYREQLKDFELIASVLHLEAEPVASAKAMTDEADKLLGKMLRIKKWHEPRKVHGRIYDDLAFCQSLANQRADGRTLSPKQLAALKKTAAKYSIQ